MSARTSYELGWDYASFCMNFIDEADKDMQRGLEEGRLHFGHKTKTATVYDRKWLQIRKNAISRNRVFDDSVTPTYLRRLDESGRCPVSRVTLTQGTMTDTDWSIDRVINEGGYTRGNLMVVSSRVNHAKGKKSLADVRAIFEESVIDTSMSIVEWTRLFRIMQNTYSKAGLVSDKDYLPMPIDMYYPLYLSDHYTEVLQKCLLAPSALGERPDSDYSHGLNIMRHSCNDLTSKAKLKKLLNKLAQKYREVTVPVAVYSYPSIWRLFVDLVDYQKNKGIWPEVLYGGFDNGPFLSQFKESLALQSNGYEVG